MKVDSVDESDSHDKERRMQFLLASRGGLGIGECKWLGCAETQVKGSAYCLNHLYTSGSRI